VLRGLSALANARPLARPGLSVPGSTAPYQAAPSATAEQARPIPGRPLRRSLKASVAEGIFAELVMACAGGSAITGWALYLGCNTFVVGLLGALPFLAQLLQVPGAWLTSRFGSRRTAIWTVGLSRQAFLPLVLLPVLPLSAEAKQWTLVAVAALHHGLGILCNNAWVTWMGNLVPARIRGRYFGRRTAICTFAATVSVLSAGLLLDGGKRAGVPGVAFSLLALTACLAGAVSTYLMSLKHDAEPPGARGGFSPARVLRPLREPAARRLLGYQVSWNAAIGLAAPFFGVYLLKDLGFGFTLVALQGAGIALTRVLTAPLWGRAVDRIGARPVLIACSFGLALCPVLWLCARPDRLWPIALEAVLAGVLLGGHGLAAFALPLTVAPRKELPFFHAAFAMAGGGAFAFASLLGSALAQQAPAASSLLGWPVVALHLPFFASVIARFCAAVLALRLPRQDTRTAGELPRGMGPALLRSALARPTIRARARATPTPAGLPRGPAQDEGLPRVQGEEQPRP
jgi:MFS family permease